MSHSSDRIDRLSPAKSALLAVETMRSRLEELERRKTEPIAIVGLGCRFPGGGTEPESFWQLLREGRDAVTEIPGDRWDVGAFYDPDPEAAGKSYTRQGAYLQDVARFDAAFFGISPREAVHMDPQQRLLLEVCWETLENAGFPPDRMAGTRTGVFVGICNGDYRDSLEGSLDPSQIDAYTGTGNLFSVAAGRVSHALGLNGPCLAIDTACSSSLVAVHLACQSLRLGECEMALAGGVNLILSPFGNVFLSRAQAIAADGRCRSFDAAASGYGRGEGCGIVALKRLSEAIAAGDRLLATIRGSAVNHDGRSSGLTVPNGSAQQALLRLALENAGVHPDQVSYVEAHGTGTALGDPIEVRALAAALCKGRSPDQPLVIGSVKTNIGHLEAAAGVAGLIKVVLSLLHDEIPPHLHLNALNPHITELGASLSIPTRPRRWPVGEGRRLAGVSAFGLGGTNAHVIVEAAPAPTSPPASPDRPMHVLPLSARCEEALGELIAGYQARLAGDRELCLADVAHTAGVGRCHFSERAAVVAATSGQALECLDGLASGTRAPGVFRGRVGGRRLPSVHFVFGGGDALGRRMGRELYDTHPPFRATLDHCARVLQAALGEPLACWTGPDVPGLLDEPRLLPLGAVALNYALADLWRSWGIEAAGLIGEDLGLHSAAMWAGAFSLEEGLRLATDGVRTVRAPAVPAPVAVGAGDASGGLEAGSSQSPTQGQGGVRAAVRRASPSLPVRSLARGEAPAEGSLWLQLVPAGTQPTGALSSLGEKGDWAAVVETLASLYVHGLDVDWTAFDRPYARSRVALPSYPFQRQRFWREGPKLSAAASQTGARRGISDPLLGRRLQSPIPEAVFESSYSVASLPCLGDHRFYGTVIVAGASYLSMALAGAAEELKGRDHRLTDVAFPQPMILEAGARTVQLILSPQGPGRWDFRVVSTDPAEGEGDERAPVEWRLHAAGRLEAGGEEMEVDPRPSLENVQQRVRDELSAEEFYRIGRASGMDAGPTFRWVHRLWRGEGEALAEMTVPPSVEAEGGFHFHPGLIDSCFQILGVCLPAGVYPPAPGQIPVVAKVELFHARRRPTGRTWAHLRLRPVAPASDGTSFDSDIRLFDDDGELVLEVRGLQIRLLPHGELVRRHHKQVKRWAHEIQWAPARSPREAKRPWTAETWLILSDRRGFGTALAESLRAAGHRCLLALPAESFACLDGDRYEVAYTDPRAFDPLFQALDPSGERRLGVVHAWSLDLEADEAPMERTLQRARNVSLQATLTLLRSLAAFRAETRLWLVTQGAQPVEALGRLSLAQSPLWGLGQVLALEHPELRCTRVDLDAAGGPEQATLLLDELRADDREDRVAYRGGARHVARLVPGPPLSISEDPPHHAPEFPGLFDPQGTYLITGGTGALGRRVAAWLASEGVRHLLLVSRRVGGAEEFPLVQEIERLGATVRIVAADVAHLGELAEALGTVDPQHPLRGVVHAAGTLDDAPLLELDGTRLSSVLAPKIEGAWNLHRLTRSCSLEAFILFSSSASVLGNPGQANYAAANAFLDALAHERQRQGLPALSVNWGPWSGGQGMAARLGPREVERWTRAGIGFLSPRQGVEALGQILLRRALPQVAVLPIEWARFGALQPGEPSPFLSKVVPSAWFSGATAGSAPATVVLAELHARAPHERRALLMEHLRAQAAFVLGLSASARLDPEAGLEELGLDSLMAIELRNALQESLGRPLAATLLYDHPTLEGLADHLLVALGGGERG